MKKLIALLLVLTMVFAFAGCKSEVAETEAEQVSLFDALKNTFEALKNGNMTIDIEVSAETTEESAPGLVSGYCSSGNSHIQLIVDSEAKDITAYGQLVYDTEIRTFVVYDGWTVSGGYYGYEDGGFGGYYKENISETLEELFTENESGSLSDLLEELPEDIRAELETVFDLEKLAELLEALKTENLIDEEWMEDNLGYTATTENGETVHSFDVDIAELFELVFDYFKEAFVNPDDFEDLIEAGLDNFDDLNIKFKLIQTGDMITGIVMEYQYDEDGMSLKSEVRWTISEIGTTTIDTEMLAEILEELPDYEEYLDYYEDYYDFEDEDILSEGVVEEPVEETTEETAV